MSTWHFYEKTTGLLSGREYSGYGDLLDLNTPEGMAAIEGRYDHLSKRVDLATGEVVDYQPPAPPDNEFETFEWNVEVKRWISKPTTAAFARDAREERNRRIAASDWVLLRAADQGTPVPQEWLTYRQALRDVSNQPGFPLSIEWPNSP